MIPKFKATITQGKMILEDRDMFRLWISKFEGKPVEVVIKRPENPRTIPQNKYYWKVLVRIIAQEIGEDDERTHQLLKAMFLKDYKIVKEKRYTIVLSTRDLNTVKFSIYNEKIRQWAATELGMSLPEPGEVELD